MVQNLFLQFASTAPMVDLSPEAKKKTCLGSSSLPEPSPNSKSKRHGALEDPSKKGLTAYDKVMQSHEAAVKRGITELDKATQDFREAAEKNNEFHKHAKERLDRKKKRADEAAADGRRTGLSTINVPASVQGCIMETVANLMQFVSMLSNYPFVFKCQ